MQGRETVVQASYFVDSSSRLGSFTGDLKVSLDEADVAGDEAGRDKLLRLWLEYLDHDLLEMRPSDLRRYIAGCSVWKSFGKDPVIKTADTPCVAFVCLFEPSLITIIAIAACYRYGVRGSEGWWNDTVLPRLQTL